MFTYLFTNVGPLAVLCACSLFILLVKPQLAIARLRLHASMMSICLSVCRQNDKKAIFSKTKQFRWCLLTTYIGSYVSLTGFFKEPIIGSLQSKMAEIRHLENRHDVILFLPLARGWSDLDKISQTGTE